MVEGLTVYQVYRLGSLVLDIEEYTNDHESLRILKSGRHVHLVLLKDVHVVDLLGMSQCMLE